MSAVRETFKKRHLRNSYHDYYLQTSFRYNLLFFGTLIFVGKKLSAFNKLIAVKYNLKLREKKDPAKVFLAAVMQATPNIYLLPLKLGGRSVGVPLPISEKKKITWGIRLIVKPLKERFGKITVASVTDVLISSIYGRGLAIERKFNIYKTGNQNRHLLTKLFVNKRKVIKRRLKARAFRTRSLKKKNIKNFNKKVFKKFYRKNLNFKNNYVSKKKN